MKRAFLAPLAFLGVAACSQPASGDSDKAAQIAANTRPDGSVINESKPHGHTEANAHSETMDMAMMTPQPADSVATRGYKQSMMRMMQGMPPYTGDADVDFNKQMRIHHIAAIDMAQVQLANGTDAESRALATKIIADQKREVAQIDAWLRQRGQ
jgi:uncharacterized protein (DUF305 family)